MAAYAGLLSVMHTIDQLQHHPCPPISLDKKQLHLLTEKVIFLQEFLEGYDFHRGYSKEADPLESRIADAAYAVEDVIESHIVDQITSDGEKIIPDALYHALELAIQDMELIQKEAMEIKETVGSVGVQHQLQTKSTPPDSSRSSSITQKSSMVGADDLKLQMMDKLTNNCLDLQVIPIVGMGGTGKTTLAINVYQERLIKEHFDIRAWTTISQEYSLREIFMEILGQLIDKVEQKLSEGELGEMLYKHMYGRKYLIIMDDMWSINVWDGVRNFFPGNNNGSRIVVTTRLSNLVSQFPPNSDHLKMQLLGEVESWELLSKTVFGEEGCSLELEEIGKRIATSCKGLPLSIVVVGGFLAKSEPTREFWGYVEENLNSIVTLEDNERCLKIIHMSFKQLPVYLKPCFLYMGVFPEDHEIRVSTLTKLWLSEGFLKPVSGKTLEEIALEHVKALIGRNLVLVHELGSTGNTKYCKIHDLLRDFCLMEAQKERFYNVVASDTPRGITDTQRRIVVPGSTSRMEMADALRSTLLARSLIWDVMEELPSLSLRLLRIFHSRGAIYFPGDMIHQVVNSRYLTINTSTLSRDLPSSICRFWNLQTLIVKNSGGLAAPAEIWYMSQIRHIEINLLRLSAPPSDGVVLGNLQTLVETPDFTFSEEVVRRIPNVKKLKAMYRTRSGVYSLRNLACLHKLESLEFRAKYVNSPNYRLRDLNLPRSLKKLYLSNCFFECWRDLWEEMAKLPLLEKLKLHVGRSSRERELETVEGTFPRLKFLEIDDYYRLETWTTESSHFPCLERLVLVDVNKLKEIPLEFADITTLRLIELKYCSNSVAASAGKLVEMQDELYGEVGLQVRVLVTKKSERDELESLAIPNFQVT